MELDVLNEAIGEGGGEEKGTTDDTTTEETTETTSPEDDPLSSLDKFDFSKVEETDRSNVTTVSDILSRDRETPRGEFTPNVEQFREFEDFMGTRITGPGGDALSAERIDPRFQDLPKLRAKAQGIIESVGRDALKSIPQTLTQFGELAGYIGDVQAYDDAFRGLVNYVSEKATGEPVMSEDYEDLGNWLSETARETSTTVDELLPVYRQDPSKVWAPGDPAWWTTNVANLVETVGAFAGVSSGVAKGLGYLTRGAARAAGTGARVNTLRGGAKPFKYADYSTNAGTSLSTSYAEGMLVGMQNYKRTYQNEKQKLLEEGVAEPKAEKRAKEAAGQAAATTAGINSVILPFLNFTQAATLTRGSRRGVGLTNESLKRGTGETFENIGQYASRIKGTSAATNLVSKEAQELLRESAFESAEEMSARIAEVEGQYIDEEDAPSAGDRLGEALFSSQSALEATLGAIAGAGQQGIMRSIPTIDDPQGEGFISRRELEWQREAEYAAKDKEVLKKRVDDMVEAKSMLAEARELEQQGNQREAQEKRDKAMNKIRASLTADNIARGVEGQMKGVYRSIENMNEDQAEQMGFDTDPESDQYYKDVARDERNKIEQYTQEYKDLNEQYNFSTQEEFADIPKTLLNLRIQEDNARRRAEKIKDQKRRVGEDQPTEDEFEEQARLDIKRERELQNLKRQRDAIQSLKDLFNNWNEESTRNLTMGDIIDNMGAQRMRSRLDEAREALPEELFESIRDLRPQDALNFADYVINKRQNQIDELNNLKTEAYEDFLTMIDMEDSQEARNIFQLMKDQIQQDYKNAYEELDRRQKNAEAVADSVRRRYNYFTSQTGREQLVDSVKSFFEDVKEKSESEAQAAIMNAETEEEVDNLLDSFPNLVNEQIEELAQQRKEEIRSAQMDRQEEDRIDPDSQEAEENAEDIADEMESEAEQGFGEQLKDEVAEDTEEDQSPQDKTFSEAVEEEGISQGAQESPTQTLREGVNRYVDNREFENEEQVKDKVEEFIDQKVANRDLLSGVLERNEGLKESLIRGAVDRYQTNKSLQEVKEEAEGDVDPTDRSPENVAEERDGFESEKTVKEDEEGRKLIESGSSVTYFSDNYLSPETRREEIEYAQIEASDVMLAGTPIEYRVLTKQEAERQGFNQEDIENGVFREDINDVSSENIDNAVIGIYHATNLAGYLRRPDSINEETTATDIKNVADNIEKNKSLNRGIRKTILKQLVEEGNVRVPGKVTKKWAGHLTINRDENGNREMQTLEEGFPNDVTFFVTRYQEPDTGLGPSVSKENLLNNEEFFERNEGAAGIIVTMGNGERMAVPIWLPRLGEIDAEGNTIVETLYQIGIGAQEGSEVTSAEGYINLQDPNAVDDQLSRYVYTTSSGIFDLLKSEGRRDVHVVSSDNGVAVVNQRTDEVYHTNPDIVDSIDAFDSWQQNEERVKELLSQMRLNVDLDSINQQKDPTDRDESVLKADEDGNLRIEQYRTQNDLIKQYTETDLDANYEINGQNIAYQRPTVNTKPTIGESTDDTNPDIDKNKGNPTGPSESTSRSTESAEEAQQESEVEGDTKDVRSTDVDQDTSTEKNINEKIDEFGSRLLDLEDSPFESMDYMFAQTESEEQAFIEENVPDDVVSTGQEIADQISESINENVTIQIVDTDAQASRVSIRFKNAETGNQVDVDYGLRKSSPTVNTERRTFTDTETVNEFLRNQVGIEKIFPTDENQVTFGYWPLVIEPLVENLRSNKDYDEMALEIAEEINERDITLDEFIEENEGEILASTARDLRDQIESAIEDMTDITDDVRSEYNSVNTRTDQDTDSLKESIDTLNELEEQLENEGVSLESDLYNEIQQDRSKLEDEMVSRGQNVDNRSDNSINEDITDDIEKGLGFNQVDLSQNTYTQEGVLQKDINGGEENISESIIQEQIEQDIADGKLNIRCKT